MFASIRKSLPALDYVSMVASVYKDPRAMLYGMLAGVIGAFISAYKTDSALLYAHGAVLLVVAVIRYFNMVAFEKAAIAPDDADAAEYWEGRAVLCGFWGGIAYGSWCFSSVVFVGDAFAELTSIAVTVGAMVGIATRNFGIDRLMTVQILGMGGPMAVSLLLRGDIYHFALATLFFPMLFSFRSLGGNARRILLQAVHDRVAASRMAVQLDTALDTMQHGLCMLDQNGVIAVANERAQETFPGLSQTDWIGRSFADLLESAIDRHHVPRTSAERLLGMIGRQEAGKIVFKLSDDYYCEVTVSSRGDRTVLLFENVSQRVRSQERINYMARFDSLTALPNRGHFTEQVQADLGRLQHGPAEGEVMVMIIDLDDFKHINDSKGHLMGDRVLAEVASRISTVMHRQSLLARFGGDEFIVYRSQVFNDSDVAAEASAILRAFNQPILVAGERIDMRASIGVVTQPPGHGGLDELVSRADLALYRAKGQGKGCWAAFAEEMDEAFRYRQKLKADLRRAVAEDRLRLVYQPLVNLQTRRVEACEALARWDHHELGEISPTVFIELAEEIGAIGEITGWVLRTATAECAQWPESVSVSVNISARDFRTAMLQRQIDHALGASGLSASRLEIEVTETTLIEEWGPALEGLNALAARGIRLALDDFGTGYSSLSYLHEMPFNKLKIDRSFVADIVHNDRSLKLISNVARLGKELGLVITAEGVETQDQLDAIIRATTIDQIQGYLFGPPLPAAEIRDLVGAMSGMRTGPDRARHTF